MKKSIILSLILLTSCYGLRNIRTENTEMVVKYTSPFENGSCIYYIRPVKGSCFHGRVRIIDTIGRYSCGDKFILNQK